MSVASRERVVLARFGAPHGVRGELRLKTFTADPAAVNDYGPLSAPDGRVFVIEALRPAPGGAADMMIARVAGIRDRTEAEALTGLELSVPRDRLPSPDDEDDFYHADLIGLAAIAPDGTAVGTVLAVHNHGAGDIVEIALPTGPSVLVPFTRAIVPMVDIAGGRIIVIPPAEGDDEDDGEEA